MASKPLTRKWDVVNYLQSEVDQTAYLEAAFEDGDAALVAAAIGDIARARGMTQLAKDTGLGRESLYKSLSENGNPELATVLKVLRSLNLRLHVSTML